jgi:hypothetical protein
VVQAESQTEEEEAESETEEETEEETETEEAESSDFGPIKIGKREGMSPASAMRRNQHPLSLSNEEKPPRLRRGLGDTNIVNVVDATAPVQHRKVTPSCYTLLQQANLESKCKAVHSHQTKSLLKRESGIQDVTDERPTKKRRLSSRNKDNVKRTPMQQEMVLLKQSVQRIEAEVREANVTLKDLLHEIQWQREE